MKVKQNTILFFVDDFKGGAGNVVQIVAKGLEERNYCVHVCCVGGNTPGRHNLEGVKVHRLTCKSKRYIKYFEMVRGIKRIISLVKPDCIISFLFAINAMVGIALGIKKIPFITSERSNPFAIRPHGIFVPMLHYAYRKSERIVVLFDAFKALENEKYIDKTITISNPVPKCPIYEYNTDYSEGLNYVTIANYSEVKGYDVLIRAFAKLVKEYPNSKLEIYGKDTNDSIKKLIEEYRMENNIFLMGYVLDVNKVLQKNDIYVLSSRHEGFPNSLCEAMSAGKACIATRCHAGMTELISDGEDGILVSVDDVDELTAAMSLFYKDNSLIRKYGNKARRIADKYRTDVIINKWVALIEDVLK